MTSSILRIATRKSPLALWQANHVAAIIRHHWPDIKTELRPMQTSGDRFLKDRLQTIGGKGLFVKELEESILRGDADIAVHSMKDVPVQLPDGLGIVTICPRDNPFDAFIAKNYDSLEHLPEHAVIGTTSLRRQAQLRALRPDLIIKPLRGNINTRLAKLEQGDFDAIILAAAGLMRMGMNDIIKNVFSDAEMLPACGQGALGIECRLDSHHLHTILAPLHDVQTATAVHAERHVNALLGGNCHVPLAVYGKTQDDKQMLLQARLFNLDGSIVIADQQQGLASEAIALADKCAHNMLDQGAAHLLASTMHLINSQS